MTDHDGCEKLSSAATNSSDSNKTAAATIATTSTDDSNCGYSFRRPRKSALKVSTQSASLQSSWEASSHEPKYLLWKDVRIRNYERTVGDNPSCSSGVPLR